MNPPQTLPTDGIIGIPFDDQLLFSSGLSPSQSAPKAPIVPASHPPLQKLIPSAVSSCQGQGPRIQGKQNSVMLCPQWSWEGSGVTKDMVTE